MTAISLPETLPASVRERVVELHAAMVQQCCTETAADLVDTINRYSGTPTVLRGELEALAASIRGVEITPRRMAQAVGALSLMVAGNAPAQQLLRWLDEDIAKIRSFQPEEPR